MVNIFAENNPRIYFRSMESLYKQMKFDNVTNYKTDADGKLTKSP